MQFYHKFYNQTVVKVGFLYSRCMSLTWAPPAVMNWMLLRFRMADRRDRISTIWSALIFITLNASYSGQQQMHTGNEACQLYRTWN